MLLLLDIIDSSFEKVYSQLWLYKVDFPLIRETVEFYVFISA